MRQGRAIESLSLGSTDRHRSDTWSHPDCLASIVENKIAIYKGPIYSDVVKSTNTSDATERIRSFGSSV